MFRISGGGVESHKTNHLINWIPEAVHRLGLIGYHEVEGLQLFFVVERGRLCYCFFVITLIFSWFMTNRRRRLK